MFSGLSPPYFLGPNLRPFLCLQDAQLVSAFGSTRLLLALPRAHCLQVCTWLVTPCLMSWLKFPLLAHCPIHPPLTHCPIHPLSPEVFPPTFTSCTAIFMTWTYCVHFFAFVFIMPCSATFGSPIKKSIKPPLSSVYLSPAPSACQMAVAQ